MEFINVLLTVATYENSGYFQIHIFSPSWLIRACVAQGGQGIMEKRCKLPSFVDELKSAGISTLLYGRKRDLSCQNCKIELGVSTTPNDV